MSASVWAQGLLAASALMLAATCLWQERVIARQSRALQAEMVAHEATLERLAACESALRWERARNASLVRPHFDRWQAELDGGGAA